MVVTRRQSASPVPPVTSRTSSSSGSSRSSGKAKGTDKTSPLKESSPGPSHVAPNGMPSKPPPVGQRQEEVPMDAVSPPAPPKSAPTKTSPKSKAKSKAKKSSKSKKHHANKGISLFDMLARLFLLWLTIYTLSVCPEDTERRSTICRVLSEYRRVVLEPYIYPPIRTALDHPAIAPHIQRVQPYYNHALQTTTPWIRLGKREWRNRVVPRLQWLQLRAQPYVMRVERQYDLTVGPYVRQVTDTALRYGSQAEPYLIAAAAKSHQSWETAKPYLMPVWQEVKQVPGIVAVHVGGPLGHARRQWVDPHVTKIWDAVVEQGKADTPVLRNANTKSSSLSFTSASSRPISSVSGAKVASSSIPAENVSPTSSIASVSPPPVPEPTDDAAASASSIVVESASVTESSTTSSTLVGNASNPGSDAGSSASPSIPAQTDEAAVSASSIIHETASLPLASAKQIPTSSDVSNASPSDADDDGGDEDIEYLESLLSEPNVVIAPVVAEPPPTEPEESEEQREERLRLEKIKTAEMRADIEARHDKWETDIEKLGKQQQKAVETTLKKLRYAASDEARTANGPVRSHIEALVQEAERSLKSLRAYARKLSAEDKPEGEKVKQWETVLDKVDKKFGERVDSTAQAVKGWWDAQVEDENNEISWVSRQVTLLADRAQENLGFDYAWLPDVTYEDWQRFHKLLDMSKHFVNLYAGMQNGTVPDAPGNPVQDVMEAIQEEVDDVILGFEANLDIVKRAAIDSFSATKSDTSAASSAGKVAPSAAEELAKAKSTPSVTTNGLGSIPEVSILPIQSGDTKEKAGVPPVILSRGTEEVESAVSRAEEAKMKAAHTEL